MFVIDLCIGCSHRIFRLIQPSAVMVVIQLDIQQKYHMHVYLPYILNIVWFDLGMFVIRLLCTFIVIYDLKILNNEHLFKIKFNAKN